MNRFGRTLSLVAAAAMTCIIMCSSTFAITADEQAWLESKIVSASDSGIVVTESWINNWVTTDPDQASSQTPLLTTSGSNGAAGVTLYLKSGKDDAALSSQIQRSISGAAAVDDVSDITDGLKIEADTSGAAAMMQGFSPIISLVLGIIVTLITIGMTIFSAFDIAYIAFPVFRNKCEDAKVQGNGAMVKKGANGESSLRWVTDDAQYAVSQGTIESGKSPWSIYFGKRVMSYILLAIILFILLTGNISLITNIALKIVSGIMNVLGGLA